MSLILEALKKSETRRRLGEAPDIGTPFTVKPRRRSPWPPIVVLIAVAAGIGWWYVRTMPAPTDANTIVALPAPPASPATGKSSVSAQQNAAPVAKAAPSAPARDLAAVQAQPKSEAAPAAGAKGPARADGSTVGAAAPGGVPDLQAMRPMNRHLPTPTVPTPAGANQKPPVASAAAVPPPASRAVAPPGSAPAPAPAKPTTDTAITAPPAQAPVQANVAKAEPEAGAAKPAEAPPAAAVAAPAVPQYYELAYGVRKDIPQFNLSMHVFAADPAARFVVADGERKAEGDTVKEGLILREIRPDGIILEFRGQRFFYPRPGH